MDKLTIGLDTLAHQVENLEVTGMIPPNDAVILAMLIEATKLEAVRLLDRLRNVRQDGR